MDRRSFLKSSGAATIGGLAASTMASTSLAGSNLNQNARIMTLAVATSHTGLDTSLTTRRLSEDLESITQTSVQFIETAEDQKADIQIAPVSNKLEQNPTWTTLLPLIHGFETHDFSGWLATGGGAPILEQLEAETGEKILLIGQSDAPVGLWSDRELVGMHPRPSLIVTSHNQTMLSQKESGAGNIELHLSNGLTEDLETGRLENHINHALPAPLAGEPLVLTMSLELWDGLTAQEQAALNIIAAAEEARTITEAHASNQLARASVALPHAIPLPAEFKSAMAAAIEAKRDHLASISPLAGDSLASQAGYRTATGAKDFADTCRHFSA